LRIGRKEEFEVCFRSSIWQESGSYQITITYFSLIDDEINNKCYNASGHFTGIKNNWSGKKASGQLLLLLLWSALGKNATSQLKSVFRCFYCCFPAFVLLLCQTSTREAFPFIPVTLPSTLSISSTVVLTGQVLPN
jgi:hypothetical protein